MASLWPGCKSTAQSSLKALIPPRLCWHNGDWVVSGGDQQWELSPRHKGWWVFEKLAPCLQSVTETMEEDVNFKSNFPEMVIPTQGMAQHSAGAVVDLSSLPMAPPQSFWMNLRETTHPPGSPKHGCNSWLLQELELKPTDHHLIISPHFGALKRIKTWKRK